MHSAPKAQAICPNSTSNLKEIDMQSVRYRHAIRWKYICNPLEIEMQSAGSIYPMNKPCINITNNANLPHVYTI